MAPTDRQLTFCPPSVGHVLERNSTFIGWQAAAAGMLQVHVKMGNGNANFASTSSLSVLNPIGFVCINM